MSLTAQQQADVNEDVMMAVYRGVGLGLLVNDGRGGFQLTTLGRQVGRYAAAKDGKAASALSLSVLTAYATGLLPAAHSEPFEGAIW